MPLSPEALAVLHEHYRDSCDRAVEHRRLRDKLFTWVLLALVMVSFDLYSPGEFGNTMAKVITAHVPGLSMDLRYLSTLTWFAVLALTIRYCQTVVHLERQYTYVHAIEGLLAKDLPAPAFTREGRAYLSDYPAFSNLTHYLYMAVFPVILGLVAVVRLGSVTWTPWPWSGLLWLDIAISIVLVVILGLYLFAVHHRRSGNK